jgi:hypothetical protein
MIFTSSEPLKYYLGTKKMRFFTLLIFTVLLSSCAEGLKFASEQKSYFFHYGASTAQKNGFAGASFGPTYTIAVDNSQSIYMASSSTGNFVTGESSGTDDDIVITKIDSKGNMVWKKQLGAITAGAGANNVDIGVQVKLKGQTELIITGVTGGDLIEPNGGGPNNDIIVASFNTANGDMNWIKQLGGTFDDSIPGSAAGAEVSAGLSLDNEGNIYITGMTDGSLFDTNGGNNDGIIIKLGPTGDFIWGVQQGANYQAANPGVDTSGEQYFSSNVIDSNGNIYFTGYTKGIIEVGQPQESNGDILLMSYDKSGNMNWVNQLNSNDDGVIDNSDVDMGVGIVLYEDNIYFSYLTGAGLAEAFGGGNLDIGFGSAKTSNGQLNWLKQIGNVTGPAKGLDPSSTEHAGLHFGFGVLPIGEMAVDNYGNIVFVAGTNGDLKGSSGGSLDSLVASFSTQGELKYLQQINDLTKYQGSTNSASTGEEQVMSVTRDIYGNLYFPGYTTEDFLETKNSAAGTSKDLFIVKMKPNGSF